MVNPETGPLKWWPAGLCPPPIKVPQPLQPVGKLRPRKSTAKVKKPLWATDPKPGEMLTQMLAA